MNQPLTGPPGYFRRFAKAWSAARAFREYQHGGRPESLDTAVTLLREALDDSPPDASTRPMLLANLGAALGARFQLSAAPADLDAAIDVSTQAAGAINPARPSRAKVLANLVTLLTLRFEQAGDPEDLETAIDSCRQAVNATRQGTPRRLIYLSALASLLGSRYERYGQPADLDDAISASGQVVDGASSHHPDFANSSSNLGICLRLRFELTGQRADLDAAIEAGQQAAEVTPDGHPNRPAYLSNLGSSLRTRFERAADPADLDAAIDASRRAVDATPPDDPDLALYLSALVGCLLDRFNWTDEPADLDVAIDAGERAVSISATENPNLPAYLSTLAVSLRTRYDRTGNSADLEAAIDADRQAVAATPADHPSLAFFSSNLGNSLRSRFELTGNSADLNDAIDATERAVNAVPAGYAYRPAMLSNLALAVWARFGLVGDLADLDAAVETGRQAVDETPADHPDLVMGLANLANYLTDRFDWTGDLADLNTAIEVSRQALDTPLLDRSKRPHLLSNLATGLGTRFKRLNDPADLDAAIDLGRQAVEATPAGHPSRPLYLSNLGVSLSARYEAAADPADLDAAINAGQHAVEATPPGDPRRATYLSGLAASLRGRFELSGALADLDNAIDVCREAVDATAADHPDLVTNLTNLASCIVLRFPLTEAAADLDSAIEFWRRASQLPTGIPATRLTAARYQAIAAAENGRFHEAADGYAATLRLLPEVVWHGLDRPTREEHLAEWAGLTADAVACAVLDERPELAVELAEQGRSVLWRQALNLRTDLKRLADAAPALAETLDGIRTVLDSPMPGPLPLSAEPVDGGARAPYRDRRREDAADLRRRKAREWDQVLAQVRGLDGFESFLRPVPFAGLRAAAADGPVVLVNTSRYGSAAIAVSPVLERPLVVNLPGMTPGAVAEHADSLTRTLTGVGGDSQTFLEREKARRALLDVLDWLWDAAVGPVLTALGYTGEHAEGDAWPRVWWCAIGRLADLPLHAAGQHPRLRTATRSVETAVDRVVSSYAPTLNALIQARQPSAAVPRRQLTVGLPVTPGRAALHGVPGELDVLARLFPAGPLHHRLVGAQATCADVKALMATHSWVHLACHAIQERTEPAGSGFALWDGVLTIADLSGQPTQQRGLAFLSACQTASGSTRHPDESIHPAAAMQFLGYRHVVASLWILADNPAASVTEAFYTALGPSDEPGSARVARAVHEAVHTLREAEPTNPLIWAPYIHLGI